MEDNKQGHVYQHMVNCVCVEKMCDMCEHKDPDKPCKNCRTKQRKFKFVGENARDEFCKWLFTEQNQGSRVIAHNFGGYDG